MRNMRSISIARAPTSVGLRQEDGLSLAPDLDYAVLPGLSRELRDKLEAVRPETLGQAQRIEGMTPAALTVLMSQGTATGRVAIGVLGVTDERRRIGSGFACCSQPRSVGGPSAGPWSSSPVSRETERRFALYAELLTRWQRVKNLVAPSTLSEIWTRHIADSAQILALAPQARRWADLGSGAGFPGLVVAISLADTKGVEVHLVEANARKCAFLREVARECGAPAHDPQRTNRRRPCRP